MGLSRLITTADRIFPMDDRTDTKRSIAFTWEKDDRISRERTIPVLGDCLLKQRLSARA